MKLEMKNNMKNTKCQCGNEIEEYRLYELGSNRCSACAKRLSAFESKKRGIMVWNHKTAPELQIIDNLSYAQYKRDTYRRGNGSILRNISPNRGVLL